MNILYCFNDRFVPQTAASIVSVCENNANEDSITFWLAEKEVSDSNAAALVQLVESYGRKAETMVIDNLHEYFDFEYDTMGWNEVILTRLLMGEILPETIDRVLYLDGDTIIRGSLSEMYNTDLNNHIVGMISEPTADMKRRKDLGIADRPYYNSGVILVDLKKWRANSIGKRLIEFYKEKDGILFCADQDALNCVLKEEIMPLSHRYNYFNALYQYNWKYLHKMDRNIPEKEEWLKVHHNPVIIHYLGEERPWRKGNRHRYSNDYLDYLSKTQWKDTEKEDGWELYFKAYSLFIAWTYPFPSVRHTIMNCLIPVVLKFRKK